MSKVDSNNDGQHRQPDWYNPGPFSGMKSAIRPAARVGQEAGPEMTESCPKPTRDCMIDTTSMSAGPKVLGEITSGDDKK